MSGLLARDVAAARARAARYLLAGLTRVEVRRVCPRTLVGKRCEGASCWCSTSPLRDHAAVYTHRGQRVVIFESYDLTPELLESLRAAAVADGLELEVLEASPHLPPLTDALLFTRATTSPPIPAL